MLLFDKSPLCATTAAQGIAPTVKHTIANVLLGPIADLLPTTISLASVRPEGAFLKT
jgi:hypothetical protein